MEIPVKEAEIAAVEKDKGTSLQLKKNEENGKAMLVLAKSNDNMLAQELEKILLQYHINKQDQGGKARKLARLKAICAENQAPPSSMKSGLQRTRQILTRR